MFYLELIIILIILYIVYIYAPDALEEKLIEDHKNQILHTLPSNVVHYDFDNYALSNMMGPNDIYLPDMSSVKHLHRPPMKKYPLGNYALSNVISTKRVENKHPNFYANSSSQLYYTNLPSACNPYPDWSSLMYY
jgi:hypothetical protein